MAFLNSLFHSETFLKIHKSQILILFKRNVKIISKRHYVLTSKEPQITFFPSLLLDRLILN